MNAGEGKAKNCEKGKRKETSSDSSSPKKKKKNRSYGQSNDIQRVTVKQSGTTVTRIRDKAKSSYGLQKAWDK